MTTAKKWGAKVLPASVINEIKRKEAVAAAKQTIQDSLKALEDRHYYQSSFSEVPIPNGITKEPEIVETRTSNSPIPSLASGTGSMLNAYLDKLFVVGKTEKATPFLNCNLPEFSEEAFPKITLTVENLTVTQVDRSLNQIIAHCKKLRRIACDPYTQTNGGENALKSTDATLDILIKGLETYKSTISKALSPSVAGLEA